MDTSKEYIKMCNCEEIQADKPKCLQFISNIYYGNTVLDINKVNPRLLSISDSDILDEKCIWLPRQDQLQDMIKGEWSMFFNSAHGFMIVIDDPDRTDRYMAKTSEQAFLQFIMCKKYNKKWNGEEWI